MIEPLGNSNIYYRNSYLLKKLKKFLITLVFSGKSEYLCSKQSNKI